MGEGSWRVGVGSVGYFSESEAGMLRPVRLAVDTPKLQPVVRISILGFVLGHKELERGASMSESMGL